MLDKTVLYTDIKTEMTNNITLGDGSHPFDQNKVPAGGKVFIYNGISATGFDVLIQVITNKVIEHLSQNIKSSLLDRFELLESDLDSLATSLAGAGVGPATAVPAAIASYLLTSNTVKRVADKATAKSTEIAKIIYGRV